MKINCIVLKKYLLLLSVFVILYSRISTSVSVATPMVGMVHQQTVHLAVCSRLSISVEDLHQTFCFKCICNLIF